MTFLTQRQDGIYKKSFYFNPMVSELINVYCSNVLCWTHSCERGHMQRKIDLLTIFNCHWVYSFSGKINWSSNSYTWMPTFCHHGHDYYILLSRWELIELRMWWHIILFRLLSSVFPHFVDFLHVFSMREITSFLEMCPCLIWVSEYWPCLMRL